MNFISRIIMKLVGKNLGDKLGVSRTKIIAIVATLVYAYETVGPQFNLPPLPKDLFELLAAFGLWTLRDTLDKKPA